MSGDHDHEEKRRDSEAVILEAGVAVGDRLTGEPLLLPPPSSVPPGFDGASDPAIPRRDAWGVAQAERRGRSSHPAALSFTQVPSSEDSPSNPSLLSNPTSLSNPAPLPNPDHLGVPSQPTEPPPDPWGELVDTTSSVTLATESVDAIGLAERAPAHLGVPGFREEMREKYALGDFSGALSIAEMLVGRHPGDSEVRWYQNQSQRQLREMLLSKLGEGSVPVVVTPMQELSWYGLDPASFTLLSEMKEDRTVEAVVKSTVLPELEALRALGELVAQGIVRLD